RPLTARRSSVSVTLRSSFAAGSYAVFIAGPPARLFALAKAGHTAASIDVLTKSRRPSLMIVSFYWGRASAGGAPDPHRTAARVARASMTELSPVAAGRSSPCARNPEPHDLEPDAESRAQAVVDELEPVVVLVALLVLEEVREVVADLEFGPAAPVVHERRVAVGTALLQIHGAPLLAQAVDLREPAARDAESKPPVIAELMGPAQAGDRNRQLLQVEVLAVLAAVLLRVGQGGVEEHVREPDAPDQLVGGRAHQGAPASQNHAPAAGPGV